MVHMEAQFRFVYIALQHYIDTESQRMQAEAGESVGMFSLWDHALIVIHSVSLHWVVVNLG